MTYFTLVSYQLEADSIDDAAATPLWEWDVSSDLTLCPQPDEIERFDFEEEEG